MSPSLVADAWSTAVARRIVDCTMNGRSQMFGLIEGLTSGISTTCNDFHAQIAWSATVLKKAGGEGGGCKLGVVSRLSEVKQPPVDVEIIDSML